MMMIGGRQANLNSPLSQGLHLFLLPAPIIEGNTMWATKEELVDYATKAGFDDPNQYALDVQTVVESLEKGITYLPKVIANGEDKGKFIFDAWGSVEVVDADNQLLPIDDILKAMPFLIKRGGVLHLGHTNQHIGMVRDFWLEKYPENTHTSLKGIKFQAELFGDYPSDFEAREGVLDGSFRMVSFGGKSNKGYRGMTKDGDPLEIMKDLECWEFALVKKGKNPLAYLTSINGVPIHKGSSGEEDVLYKDDKFMRTVHSLLLEGVRFKEAFKAAKDIVFGTVGKSKSVITKGYGETNLEKGDVHMADESVEDRVAKLEKNMADLAKSNKDVAELVKSLDATFKTSIEDLKKELDIPGKDGDPGTPINPQPKVRKGAKEDEGIDYDKIGALVSKALAEAGFTPSGTPRPNLSKGDKGESEEEEGKVTKGGVQNPPDDGYSMFEQNYQKMISTHLKKAHGDPADVPSFMEMGAEFMGVNIQKEESA